MSMEFELTFEFSPSFSQASFNLELLRLEGECYANAEVVDRLLCSAPNIKELYIVNDHKDGRDGGYLDAEVIMDSERSVVTLRFSLVRSEAFPGRASPEPTVVSLRPSLLGQEHLRKGLTCCIRSIQSRRVYQAAGC